MFIYEYICRTLLDGQSLTNPFMSKITVKTFIETFMARDMDGVLSLRVERELYVIPKLSSYDNFNDVFKEGILTLPANDNPKIMGLHNNQEIITNYS